MHASDRLGDNVPGPDSAVVPLRLRANLRDVRDRIDAAARVAGRDPAELTLIAVSKTWPAADVVALRRLGLQHFAENREQEAAAKVEAVHAGLGLAGPVGDAEPAQVESRPTWHFVGQLQRNKANAVARWADWVQCVDRPELVTSLSRAAENAGRELTVCLQVSLDTPSNGGARPVGPGRGGVAPDDILPLADLVAAAGSLRLAGVMAVAPRGEPARPAFALLRRVAESVWRSHPEARVISAGMSGDLEAAVVEGATHLRIGTALFGERLPVP
jgi:PLP dependent protein